MLNAECRLSVIYILHSAFCISAFRLRRPQSESFVQTAPAVALRIDCDGPVANRLQLARDRVGRLRLERARQLLARDFDASELVVMAHAADAEAERAQRLLGPLDHTQLLVGLFAEVRNARRQARRRRL